MFNVSIFSDNEIDLMAFLIQDDEHLPISHSWAFCSHAIIFKVHSHFVLKSCTYFRLVQRRKHGYIWIYFFFYFGKVKIQYCLNEGSEGSTSKNNQHDKMKLQLVKALRPKRPFCRAYRTSNNHEESMFSFKILFFVLLFLTLF